MVGLGPIDWLLLLAWLGVVAVVAWRSRRGAHASDGSGNEIEQYFLAGRGIPAWAAAISFMATALSAATFMGLPNKGYHSDLTYLAANLAAFIAIAIVALVLIPAYYRSRVTTVYGYLGQRFGPGAAWAAGVTFLVGRLLASGARLFIAGSALAWLLAPSLGGHWQFQALCIGVLVLCAIGFVFIGGIRSVIWTDVCQTVIFVGGALVAIIILFNRIPLDFAGIWQALDTPGGDMTPKLKVFDDGLTDFSPSNNYSLLAIACGLSLINLGAYGADQDLTQRLLTCKDAKSGARSAIAAVLMAIPVSFLFMVVGMLLWIFYARPDLMGSAAPATPWDTENQSYVFAHFIAHELRGGPAGLMAAGLAAAAVSSLTSEVNAMASTFASDVWGPLVRGANDQQQLRIGRWAVPVAGVALGIFATLCIWWKAGSQGDVVDFALSIMVFCYAGLVAVFLAARLTRRGGQISAIIALALGFAAVCFMRFVPLVRGEEGWESLATELAFPYQMLIATALAFAVCIIPRGRRNDANKHTQSAPVDVTPAE